MSHFELQGNRFADFDCNIYLNTREGSAKKNASLAQSFFEFQFYYSIAESFNRFVTTVFIHQTKELLLSEGKESPEPNL